MEALQGAWGWIATHTDDLLQIIGAFAILARFTPNKTDDKIVQWILDTINFGGMNHGKAKNAD